MRKLLTIIALGAVTVTPARAVELEPGAILSERVTQGTADALAQVIRLYGYRCDSISAITTYTFSRGFTVKCNNWTYVYEVEDKGGQISVTVQ